jgi:hypothetical protein
LEVVTAQINKRKRHDNRPSHQRNQRPSKPLTRLTTLTDARFDINTTALRGCFFIRVIPIAHTKFCCIVEASTTGENMKHKTMATYNSDDRKADLMVIVVCVLASIAIAVMAYFGWLPGGV